MENLYLININSKNVYTLSYENYETIKSLQFSLAAFVTFGLSLSLDNNEYKMFL